MSILGTMEGYHFCERCNAYVREANVAKVGRWDLCPRCSLQYMGLPERPPLQNLSSPRCSMCHEISDPEKMMSWEVFNDCERHEIFYICSQKCVLQFLKDHK